VDPQDHVTGMIADCCIGVCGAIVQELCDGLHGGLSAFGLLCGNGAQGSEKSGVHSACIVQEHVNDLLYSFGVGGIEDWGRAGLVSILDFGSIVGFLPCMGGMLRLHRRQMAKSE